MPNSNDRHVARLRAGIEVGRSLSLQESERDERSKELMTDHTTVPLAQIQPRIHGTRKNVPSHVNLMLESIRVLGLIEPLVVDQKFRLLAGGHRLEALRRLQSEDHTAFTKHFPGDRIPVRIMAFDAAADPQQAMAIEVAENALRRDYTPTEVKKIAEELIKAGYRDVSGRPKEGEKALAPALAVVIGRSVRTVRRHLKSNKDQKKKVTSVTISANERNRSWCLRMRKSIASGIAHFESAGLHADALVQALKQADAQLDKLLTAIPEIDNNNTKPEEPPQSE